MSLSIVATVLAAGFFIWKLCWRNAVPLIPPKKGKQPPPEPEPHKPTPGEKAASREARMVFHRRFEEARAAGMAYEDAEMFANSSVYIDELRRLVAKGCPPELLGRLLL